MVDVVFVRDTGKRREGDRVSFDEVSAAKIVARGDAEYAPDGGTHLVPRVIPKGAWGYRDDSAGE